MRSTQRQRTNGHASGGERGGPSTRAQELIKPAPERYRADHVSGGNVVRLAESVEDANGGIGRPWRSLDTLARMERAGTITKSMQAAGVLFNKIFNEAGLDPLFAGDPSRTPVLNHKSYLVTARRGSPSCVEMVMDALERLGGISSPGGSCAWHVLGCEITIESWALSRSWSTFRVDPRIGTGILLTDLGILQSYYAIP
jgi:hypothetical protein